MKNNTLKLLVTSCFIGMTSLSQAALYTLSNGSGSTAAGIITTDGKTFRSGTTNGQAFTTYGTSGGPGVVSFGFFSTDDISNIASASTLVSLYTNFGVISTFGGASTGGNRSVFSLGNTQTIGTTFNGQNIYLFAGNGSTLANSTQFLVAKSTLTFNAADDVTNAVTPKLLTINPANSSVLIGIDGTDVRTTNSDSSVTAGWTMATLVPETSTSLLGAFGALALLRRRRN
jgi:hypothetical protein